jgi:hypothetical protein
MWNLRKLLGLGGVNRSAALFGVAGLLLLATATGCDDHHDRVISVDALPYVVEGVYSVTGDQAVTVYWRANQESDISYYKVYRNTAPTGTFSLVGTSTGTSFVDNSVVNGNTYYYAVAAVDQAGQESPSLSYENVFDTPRPEGFGAVITNTLTADNTSGWDFSAFATRASADIRTDMWYQFSSGSYLILTPSDTKIQDAGYVTLRDVDFAPPAGWSTDGIVEAIVGHSYIVLTRDNHYAKFEVTSRGSGSITFDWAYQIDPNNPELARGVKR